MYEMKVDSVWEFFESFRFLWENHFRYREAVLAMESYRREVLHAQKKAPSAAAPTCDYFVDVYGNAN